MIGWVARSTRAQDGPKPVSPAAPSSQPASPSEELPSPAPLNQHSDALLPPATSPDATAPNPAGPGNDDPEKNARAFIERNRRQAQGELRSLKDEAERLRMRLGKVEAGIRRWEALVAALENSEKIATAKAAEPARRSANTPSQLAEASEVPAPPPSARTGLAPR